MDNEIVNKGRLPVGIDPDNEESYSRYNQKDYAPKIIHQEALKFVERNKDDKFFVYYMSFVKNFESIFIGDQQTIRCGIVGKPGG